LNQIRYILFFLATTALFSQSSNLLHINQHTFTLIQEDYDEYDSKGKTITFYRNGDNNQKTSLFSFILEDVTGGCNDKSVEKGVYEVNGKTLTFYTLWKRVGSIEDAPFGGQIKRYTLLKNGEFKLISSHLYIEEHTEDSNLESGMKFLFKEPKTKEEKKLFKKYVTSVERRYGGKFVFNQESSKLIKEVREAIKREVKNVWKKR